jgi:hypothetical protein
MVSLRVVTEPWVLPGSQLHLRELQLSSQAVVVEEFVPIQNPKHHSVDFLVEQVAEDAVPITRKMSDPMPANLEQMVLEAVEAVAQPVTMVDPMEILLVLQAVVAAMVLSTLNTFPSFQLHRTHQMQQELLELQRPLQHQI